MSRQLTQRLIFTLIILAAVSTVTPIVLIVGYIAWKGLPAISWEFLSGLPREGMRAGGIWPAIVGTIYLTLGTGLIAVPLGVAAAIYLAEYAKDNWLTRAIRIPVINSTAEEALRAVLQSFRVVSISLGGTKWQTIWRIVLPQALPGILTGVILGLERAAGETAPILFTAAAFFLPRLPDSPFDATMALPYHLFVISTQVPSMPIQIQYGTALVLLVFVLSMMLIATIIRSRARARRQW